MSDCCVVVLTQNSGYQTEEKREDDEDPVPVVRTLHCGHPEKDEDERLTHAAPHLQEVLDGGVGLVGDVGFHIWSHNHTAGNQAVRDVRGDEGSDELHNTDWILRCLQLHETMFLWYYAPEPM